MAERVEQAIVCDYGWAGQAPEIADLDMWSTSTNLWSFISVWKIISAQVQKER